MKYIYYIILIVLLVSAIAGYQTLSKSPSEKDAAITINGRIISQDEFDKLTGHTTGPVRDELIDSIITRELMIQEAKKTGIDKDEPFRRSIQNFYEQSLIKLLVDRKFSGLRPEISDKELDAHIENMNKRLFLTVFRAASEDAARKGDFIGKREASALCGDLAGDIRKTVESMKEGQTSSPQRSGREFIVVRLDRIEAAAEKKVSDVEKEKIRAVLMEQKKQEAIDSWISGLREKASIKISTK